MNFLGKNKTFSETRLNSLSNLTFWLAIVLFSTFESNSWGQTNPTPHDLSTGNWTFTGWHQNSGACNYPGNGATGTNTTTGVVSGAANANMVFWGHTTTDPSLTQNFTRDWVCVYNLTSRSRFQGVGTNGVVFTNTGNTQTAGNCASCSGGSANAGAAVLALNSIGRENIQVAWTARLIKQENNRYYAMRLQYRTNLSGGPNANWINTSDEYQTFTGSGHKAQGDVQSFTTTLPEECENLGEFQVRWVYYYEGTGSSTRPEVALDDITVSSLPLTSYCGRENFEIADLPGSYSDGSFEGYGGITWTYGHSRNDGGYPIDGEGIMLRRASDSYLEATISGGIGTFSFDYRKAFTANSARQLEVLADGSPVATSPTFGNSSGDDATIHKLDVAINTEDDVTIRIKNVGNTTTNRQTVIDNITWTCFEPCDNVEYYFRSAGNGNWDTPSNWESSENGTSGWSTPSCAPNAEAENIEILNNHNITVAGDLSISKLTIRSGGTLTHSSGEISFPNSDSELNIEGTWVHALSSGLPSFHSNAQVTIEKGGMIRVDNGGNSQADGWASDQYSLSDKIEWRDGAIFNWNNINAFTTVNRTYFPHVGIESAPIFRISQNMGNLGANSPTVINGILEVNGTCTWVNSGQKTFRNGIVGSGTLTQGNNSGRLLIADADTAYIGGGGTWNLNNGEQRVHTNSTYIKMIGNQTVNNGQLRITNNVTLDAQDFVLSGNGDIRFNERATIITSHENGINGNFGSLTGGMDFRTDEEQTIIFERNGPQNSGTLPSALGSVIIRNGSILTLQNDLSIENLSEGFFMVDGAGSQLRVTDDIDLNINGNRSFILQNGGSMHDDCLDYLRFFTGGNSSTGTFIGNGETIKCWNFEPTKTNEGGVILASNTNLHCKNNFELEFANDAVFVDNGNTLTIGDDVKISGEPSNYEFTGTIILTGTGGGSIARLQDGDEEIKAHLNNLIVDLPASRPDMEINPRAEDGSATTIIKGNFTILNGTVTTHNNTVEIGGDFTNDAGASSFNAGESTIVFNNTTSDQNLNGNTTTFHNLKLAKPDRTLEMNTDINVTNEVQLAEGGVLKLNQHTLYLGSTGKLMDENEDNYVFCSCPSAQIVAEGYISANTPANLGNLGLSITPEIAMEYTQIVRMHEPKNLGDGTSIARIYTVSPTVNADLNATLELQFFIHEKNGLNTELLTFFRSPDGGTTWSEIGGSIDEETNLLTVTEWQHFSPVTGGEVNPSALPVALVYFNSECNTNQVILNWQTASEWNASHFEIEKSNDGANWNIIGKVNAQGTSSQFVDYSFADVELNRGQVNYYRLVQVDFDGEYEVFGPISGTCKSANDEISISVFPNPTSRNSALDITSNEEKKAAISVQSSTGQVIHSTTVQLTQGFNQFTIPSNDWADGVYIIILQPESGMPFTTKLIKN